MEGCMTQESGVERRGGQVVFGVLTGYIDRESHGRSFAGEVKRAAVTVLLTVYNFKRQND